MGKPAPPGLVRKGRTVACPICRSNDGTERISPAAPIHEGEHWIVEHAYPSALLGWLVLVLKRHAESLHDLSRAEAAELGTLQWAVSKALATLTGCVKEYSVFFAEGPGFQHVHVHMVPRAGDLDASLRGGRAFALLQVSRRDSVPAKAVAEFCTRAAAEVSSLLDA
jgi:diadenosine tetraphosphate (Ap4A) HIT family hydrolase